jgi:hypothetical protein
MTIAEAKSADPFGKGGGLVDGEIVREFPTPRRYERLRTVRKDGECGSKVRTQSRPSRKIISCAGQRPDLGVGRRHMIGLLTALQ